MKRHTGVATRADLAVVAVGSTTDAHAWSVWAAAGCHALGVGSQGSGALLPKHGVC